jgi:hypothetical protein
VTAAAAVLADAAPTAVDQLAARVEELAAFALAGHDLRRAAPPVRGVRGVRGVRAFGVARCGDVGAGVAGGRAALFE